jgi:hypothetical protein
MIKYLILFALIYMIFKYNTLKSMLSSAQKKNQSKINKNEPEEGEYIDYEEVD